MKFSRICSFNTFASFILKLKGASRILTPLFCFSLIPCPEIISLLGIKLPDGKCSVRIIYLPNPLDLKKDKRVQKISLILKPNS